MATDATEPIERWTAKRRVALVVSILKGETSVAEAARQHGLTMAEVEDWREKFLLGAENALRSRPKDEDAVKDEQIKKLKQKIGDLVLDKDILREALKPSPLDRKTSDAYRGTLPDVSERRSCQVLGVSRASLHRTEGARRDTRRLTRRGPSGYTS
ncbi:MAG: hypothetical protein A4E19_18755 [Nitrospira sp. SG-bin1]|nr:MAG: hypothetical protein A4E19_18755 [Nitrospira sp. SG-bin1]